MDANKTTNNLLGWAVGVGLLALAAGVIAYAVRTGWRKGA